MRTVQASRLWTWRAPAVEMVALLIELQDPRRRRIADPDEAVLIDEVIHHQGSLAGGPMRRTQRPDVEELAVLVEHLHALMPAINDEELPVGADRDAVDGVELVRSRVLRVFRLLA